MASGIFTNSVLDMMQEYCCPKIKCAIIKVHRFETTNKMYNYQSASIRDCLSI